MKYLITFSKQNKYCNDQKLSEWIALYWTGVNLTLEQSAHTLKVEWKKRDEYEGGGGKQKSDTIEEKKTHCPSALWKEQKGSN